MSRDQMIFIILDLDVFPMLKRNVQYQHRPSGAVLDTDGGSETQKEHQALDYNRSKLAEKWINRSVNLFLSPSLLKFTRPSEGSHSTDLRVTGVKSDLSGQISI